MLLETKLVSIDVWSASPNIVVQIDLAENSSLESDTSDNYPIGRHSRYIGVTINNKQLGNSRTDLR